MNHSEFQLVSNEVKDLIKQMLTKDPKKRPSAADCLGHKWFQLDEVPSKDLKINRKILENLASFKGKSKLKKAAMNMLIKMADTREIENLREEFQKLDLDRTGLINVSELKAAMKQSNIDIPDSEIDRIIDEVDYFGNHKINYTEFLVATLDVKQFLDENMIQALFSQFDTDNSGVITRDNIVAAMQKMGHSIT